MNGPMPQQPQGPMPQGAPQGPQGPQGGEPMTDAQPVVDAFRTIVQFIKAQEEKGNPQASAMQNAMSQLITAIQGQGPQMEQQPPMPQQGPQPMPQAPAPQPQQSAPKAASMTRGVNPNVGTGRAVPVM